MHLEILEWLRGLWHEYPEVFHVDRVLECGACVFNVGARMFFTGCREYIGVDAHPGYGVDVVSLVHEYEPAAPFDTVVSTQMLEHDPYWRQSLARMVEALKPGGSLILTWAGPGWAPHELDMTPTPGYYETRACAEIVDAIGPGRFREMQIRDWLSDKGRDIYLLALDKQAEGG